MNNLIQDLRYAVRMLLKHRGFALVAVLTLALGIGANTAIFSVVEAVLLRPLPYAHPDRLVMLWETEASPGNYPLTGPDYLDWKQQNHTFAGMALTFWPSSYNLSGQGEAAHVTGLPAEANFFSLLGARPLLGRTFAPGEDQAGKNHVAVLSYAFWQKNFAGERGIVGKPVELNGATYTIIGVMPRDFRTFSDVDLWTPLDMSRGKLGERGTHQYRAIGRLKPGVTRQQAQADLQIIAQRLQKQYPDSNDKENAVVVSLHEQLTGNVRPGLLLLLGAVGLVLLIACVNVANLLLSRAAGRQREIAVRAALGAGRKRLIAQLLTESFLLSLVGGVLGIVLAWAGLRALTGLMPSAAGQPFTPVSDFSLNGAVLAFAFGVAVVSAVLFGLAPALQLSRVDQFEELKGGLRTTHATGWGSRRVKDALIVGEVALSLFLLIGAGLLLRSFQRMSAVNVGVRADHVLTASLALPAEKYATSAQQVAFIHGLQQKLAALPGVETAAISSELPLQGGSNGYIQIPGQPDSLTDGKLVEWGVVTPQYFRALGIPLVQGRNFTAADGPLSQQITAQLVAMNTDHQAMRKLEAMIPVVINHTMAATFWPGQNPIGKEFDQGMTRMQVVGVAGDVRQFSLRDKPIPEAYFLPEAHPLANIRIVLRSSLGPVALAGEVRGAVRSMDDSLSVFRVRTMPEVIAASLSQSRFQTSLLALFALLALVLAAIGMYGVLSYQVTQQTREIGIRMALGADGGAVLQMVVLHGLKLALLGIGIGTVAALACGRLLASLLYGVSATDPVTLTALPLLLLTVALVACMVPAWRAARVDPLVALRYE